MKRSVLFFILFSTCVSYFAQDPHFSQYQNTRSYLNPAMVGTDSTLTLSTGYRLQWPGISGSYSTFHFSLDNYFRFLKGGLGIDYLHDVAGMGAFTTTRVDINYAPHIELFNHKLVLQPAIGLAYFQKSIDWTKLTFGDMIDERRGFVYNTNEVPGQNKKSNIDLSAGIFIYSSKFYGGIAVHHINQPDEGLIGPSKLPLKITLHTGANLTFKKDKNHNFILSPNLLYMQQQDFWELAPGVNAKYKWVVLGINYRNQDVFIVNAGIQFWLFKLEYSYDYTVSKLTNKATGGSHEIQMLWFIKSHKKPCSFKTIRLI